MKLTFSASSFKVLPSRSARSASRRSNRVLAAEKDVPNKYTPVLRKLGSSDLQIPDVTLGTMTWGEQNTEAEAHQQLAYALEVGVNAIDTAEMYPVPTKPETQGRTDRHIASWLKNIRREKILLLTKVSGYSDRITWVRDSKQGTRVSRDQILESVDKSLQRLGTDYIDLLQIHWPDRYVSLFGAGAYDAKNEREAIPILEQIETLNDLIKAGKIRNYGLSNETSFGVCEFTRLAQQHNLARPISIQNSYSLLNRIPFETDLAETCSPRNCDVGLLAYSPLAGGALSGKYLQGLAPAKSRFTLFPGYMERYNKSEARAATAEYVKLAEKHGLDPSVMALAFVKSRWFVTSTIIGATSLAQLKANINSFSVDLTPEAQAEIQAIFRKMKDPAISQ